MSDFISSSESGASGLLGKVIPINLSFMFTKTELGLISLDVMVKEKVTFEGKVTHYPVEDGTEISDHITQGGKTLVISGVQSVAEGYSFNFASGKGRLINVLLAMEQMHKERKLITITTGLAQYKDMGIESMTAERSNNQPRDGNWLDINMELRNVRKVTLRTADVPPQQTSARNGTSGRAGTTATRSTSSSNPAGAANDATSAGETGAFSAIGSRLQRALAR